MRYIWAFAMAAFGLGTVLVVHATSAFDLYPFPILMGFGWGAALVSMMGAPMNYFELKAYPAVIGLWLLFQTGVSALAPFVATRVLHRVASADAEEHAGDQHAQRGLLPVVTGRG
jgi:anaerobic C4-dicarboxylate transporter